MRWKSIFVLTMILSVGSNTYYTYIDVIKFLGDNFRVTIFGCHKRGKQSLFTLFTFLAMTNNKQMESLVKNVK